MVGRRIAVIILVLLLLPLASAYGVEKVWVDWNGNAVKTISPDATLPGAVIKAKLTSDTADCLPGGKFTSCTLYLRAASLSPNPADKRALNDTKIDVKTCEKTGAGIICTSAPFTFGTKTSANSITYVLRTGGAAANWVPTNIPITIDNTTPRVSSLEVGFCDAEVCYASIAMPVPYTITFEDTITSFSYRQVFIGSASTVSRVANCSGKSCTGEIKVPCMRDGDKQTVSVVSAGGMSSREDAQNEVVGISRDVICTSESPKFLDDPAMTASGTLGVPINGSSVTYVSHVRVPHGEPRAVLYTEKINGKKETVATCSQESEDRTVWTCAWQVDGLLAGKHDARFTVFAPTGNKDDSKKLALTVLNLKMPGKEGIDYFRLERPPQVLPERINRLAIDLAASNYLPYPAYVVYDLKPVKGAPHIVRQELDQCWYKLPNETNYTNSRKYNLFSRDRGESRVLFPGHDHDQTNRLNLQLRADRDVLALSDDFDVTCQLKIIVKEEGVVYGTPELENITFRIGLRESPLGQPGEEFVKRIKEEEDRLKGPDQKFIMNLRKARATLDGICQIMDGLNTLKTIGASTQVVGKGVEDTGILGIIGKVIKGFGTGLGESADKAHEATWYSEKGQGWVNKICRQVNCRGIADANGANANGLWNKGDAMDGGFATTVSSGVNNFGGRGGSAGSFIASELTNNLNAPNFQNSFVMSAMYGCVGGMIYNVGKWQDINCGYLECLKQQSINGQSVAVCEQARDTKICMQVTGEIMELPWARVITNMQRNLDDMVKNAPGLVAKFFADKTCKAYLQQNKEDPQWPQIGCHIMKATTNVIDFAKQTNQVFNPPMVDDSICLDALCNKADGDCKRSYNAVEKYSKYASYLQLNAWLRNKQKQSGDANDQALDNAISQIMEGSSSHESVQYSGTAQGSASPNDGITAAVVGEGNLVGAGAANGPVKGKTYISAPANWYNPQTKKIEYGYKVFTYGGEKDGKQVWSGKTVLSTKEFQRVGSSKTTTSTHMPFTEKRGSFLQAIGMDAEKEYSQYIYLYEYDTAALSAKSSAVSRDFSTVMAGISKEQAGRPAVASPAPAAPPKEEPKKEARIKAVKKSQSKQNGKSDVTVVLTDGSEHTIPADSTDAKAQAALDEADRMYGFFKAKGVPPELYTEQNYDALRQALGDGYVPADQAALDEYMRVKSSGEFDYFESRATLIEGVTPEQAKRRTQLLDRYNSLKSQLDTCTECTEQQKQQLASAVKTARENLAKEQVYISGSDQSLIVPQDKRATVNPAALKCDGQGICTQLCDSGCEEVYYFKDAQGNVFETKRLERGSANKVVREEKNMAYWQNFDFIANIAVKWAYDEGYLNFLQTSSYGEWGRDASQWSSTYISPEGWQKSICNNIYDIQDRDDGVILEPTAQGFTKISGTFAAEVREIKNETNTSYVYVYTIYVTNPQRPVPQGQRSNGDTYNFKMDVFFDTPEKDTCVTTSCAPKKDIIDGRFKLSEGTNFAKGAGPRRGVLYLPAKYTRMCITFDRPYPGPGGKTSYCREIKEDIYDTGSPYVPGATRAGDGVAGTSGSAGTAGTAPDPDGTGNLEGEV